MASSDKEHHQRGAESISTAYHDAFQASSSSSSAASSPPSTAAQGHVSTSAQQQADSPSIENLQLPPTPATATPVADGQPSQATKTLERLLHPSAGASSSPDSLTPRSRSPASSSLRPTLVRDSSPQRTSTGSSVGGGGDWTANLAGSPQLGSGGSSASDLGSVEVLKTPTLGLELTQATRFVPVEPLSARETSIVIPPSPTDSEPLEQLDFRTVTPSSTTGDIVDSYSSGSSDEDLNSIVTHETAPLPPPKSLPSTVTSSSLHKPTPPALHDLQTRLKEASNLSAPPSAARKRSLDRRGGRSSSKSGAQTPDVDIGGFDYGMPFTPDEDGGAAAIGAMASGSYGASSSVPVAYQSHASGDGAARRKNASMSWDNRDNTTPTREQVANAGSKAYSNPNSNFSPNMLNGTGSPAPSIRMAPLTHADADASMDSFSRYPPSLHSPSSSSSHDGKSPPYTNGGFRRYSGPNSTPPVLNEKFNPRAHTYSIIGFDSAYPPHGPGAMTSSVGHGSRQRLLSTEDHSTQKGGYAGPPTATLGYSAGSSTLVGSEYSANGGKKMSFRDLVNMDSVNPFSWDTMDGKPEPDDDLHDPAKIDPESSKWSKRAILNIGSVGLLALGLVMLFAGYPIIREMVSRHHYSTQGGFGLGGTNATGQVSSVPGVRTTLIDPDTPPNAYTRKGSDGSEYNLVFSDEFEMDGRSFYPGDDPYWTAVDLHYWATNNFEWYSPDAVTTVNGSLRITLSQYINHNLNFRGGMVQSWNQLCFQGGILVASVRLPGSATVPGLWPAVWTMGNLGRAGYGASLEGLWPYAYETCDVGTLANQTDPTVPDPDTDLLGDCVFNQKHFTKSLSFLPGQRLSACTCPGEDHPGPQLSDGTFKGRSAPEIDLFEAQVSGTKGMTVSQSAQLAPFNAYYKLLAPPQLFTDQTIMNTYTGEVTQQAASAVTPTDQQAVQDLADGSTGVFSEYGIEYLPGDDGYIEWINNGNPTWRLGPDTLAADPVSKIARRPVTSEPMYIIMNVGISRNFGTIDWAELQWPNYMDIDWVRLYQKGDPKIGCNPSDYPTEDYINRHMEAYTNANLTLWGNTADQGGYQAPWPRNKLYPGGCDAAASTFPGGSQPMPKAVPYTKAEIGVDQNLCKPPK